MSGAPSRLGRIVAFASALLVGVALLPGTSAAAQAPVDAGRITVVDERRQPISGGGSDTKFTFLIPPERAYCPGDSQNDNYRVHSFMVPVDVAATDVTYNGLGPTPQHWKSHEDFRMPLYDEFTADFTASLTAEKEAPDGPGRIVTMPNLWFGVYREGELPLGRYRIGIVCNHLNDITRYWDTEIVVEADADDPAALAWRVLGASTSEADAGGLGLPVLAGVAAVAAVALALLIRRRRTSRPHQPVGRS